jgi:hypothetical protein
MPTQMKGRIAYRLHRAADANIARPARNRKANVIGPPKPNDVGAGMFLESARLVGSGAWALVASVAIAAVDAIGVVAQSIRRPPVRVRPAA